MKKIRWALAAAVLTLGLTGTALAADANRPVTLGQTDTTTTDYFAAGNSVEVLGTVNGDAYVAGSTVEVSGTVNGDLLVAGGNVRVSGKVTGSVRAAGGTVEIVGEVGRNVNVAGGTVRLASGAKVAGNVLATGGTVEVDGTTGGNVFMAGSTAVLSGTVGGRVDGYVDSLAVRSSAVVAGGLAYTSANNADINSAAKLSGKVEHKQPPAEANKSWWSNFTGDIVWQLFGGLLLGLVVLWLAPRASEGVATVARKQFGLSLGVGAAALLVTPIVTVLVMVTFVGLPLGIVLLSLYVAGLMLAQVATGLTVGLLLNRRFKLGFGLFAAYLVGGLVYWLAGRIPYLGGFVGFVGLITGLGAIVIYLAKLRRQDHGDKPAPVVAS